MIKNKNFTTLNLKSILKAAMGYDKAWGSMKFLIKFFAFLCMLTANPLQGNLTLVDGSEQNGWAEYQNSRVGIMFPATPETILMNDSFEQYVAVDISNFPVVIYSLGIIKPKHQIDIESFINDALLSDTENTIIWHEVSQSDNQIVLDLIRTKKQSKMLQKERFVMMEDMIYQLVTLCYPIGAENHCFFVSSFNAF